MRNSNEYKAKGMSRGVFVMGGVIVFLMVVMGCVIKEFIGNNNVSTNDDGDIFFDDSFDIVYEEEEYVTYGDDESINTLSTRNLPVITNDMRQDVCDRVVSSLVDISSLGWNNIKEAALGYEGDDLVGVDYLISTGVVLDGRLTFIFNMDGSFGGVSWVGVTGYNYSVDTGDLLELEDVFYDYESAREILYEKIVLDISGYDYVNDLYNDDISGVWSDLVYDLMDDTGNWFFTDSGISFVFPKYSLGSGYVGVVRVDIPLEVVNDYLVFEYKI